MDRRGKRERPAESDALSGGQPWGGRFRNNPTVGDCNNVNPPAATRRLSQATGFEMQGMRRSGLDTYQQPAFQAGIMLEQTMRRPSHQGETVLWQQPALPPGWPYHESASTLPYAAASPQQGASVFSHGLLPSPQRSPLLAPPSYPDQQHQRILSLLHASRAPQLLSEGQQLEGRLARQRLRRKREAALPKVSRSLLIQERSDRKGLAASNFPLPQQPGAQPTTESFSHEGLLDRYMSTWTQLDTQTAAALRDDQASSTEERSRFVRERFSHAIQTNAVNFLGHPAIDESEDDDAYGIGSGEEEDRTKDN